MNLQKDIPLKNYTTVQIGGPAKFFVTVDTQEELIEALKYAKNNNLPHLMLGGGSNLLVSDEGFPGLVIRNQIQDIIQKDNLITVSSGTPLGVFIGWTLQNNFSGFQKLIGIPGTIGGAIYGNAGAYGAATADFIDKVTCFDGEKIITLSKDECQFGYRSSIFKKNGNIILSASFTLEPGNSEELIKIAKETLPQRNKYGGLKSPGSFFKNIPADSLSEETLKQIPEDKINHGKLPAGYLLESIGAKGKQVGDIQVSDFHANLITNLGAGTAKDFHQLASELVKLVKEKFGITLEPEVQLINLPPLG